MTQDEIIRMAKEACQPHQILNTDLVFLERFYQLAFAAGAARGREVCAKICDEVLGENNVSAAIRARNDFN